MTDCPCGSGRPLEECCGPLHSGVRKAATPEALMRSRYTAYVLNDVDYLLATTHPDSRLHRMADEIREGMQGTRWIQLTVLSAAENRVEFIAEYISGGRLGRIHERSLFKMQNGEWFYVGAE